MTMTTAAPVRKYGWKRDLPDHRDNNYRVTRPVPLPAHVDWTAQNPHAYDQSSLGSCTGQGWARLVHYNKMKQHLEDQLIPSRLFIYYCEREIEGTLTEDSGAQIRDGVKALVKWGVPDEKEHPYVIENFMHKPSEKAYAEAAKHKITKYQRVNDSSLYDVKHCLADENLIVFGCSIYESFESEEVARTGHVPTPGHHEQMMGGHCMVIIGYDDAKKHFIVYNSWGSSWGDKGRCYMPYDYLIGPLGCDFWTLFSV